MPARAQIYPSGAEKGYWFYFTTPATVEQPLVGIGYVAGLEGGKVEGDLFLDAENRQHTLLFGVTGTGRESGKVDITLSVCIGRTHRSDPCAGHGPEVLNGTLTINAPENSNRTTWAGTLKVMDKEALQNHLGSDALKQAGMSTVPDEVSLEIIGFKNLDVSLGEIGLKPTLAKATWLPDRDADAQKWLKANGIRFWHGEDWEDKGVWEVDLLPFEQNLTVYRMLRSGIFDEVTREALGAGPGSPPPTKGPRSAPIARIRVGADVEQAKLIKQPKPIYPPLAKSARVRGDVKLKATIGRDGTIQDLEVLSGHPLLVPSAIQAVQQWVYKPTLVNGEAVEVITTIDVNFQLSGKRDPSEIAEQALAQLQPGAITYDPPREMKVAVSTSIQVRIGKLSDSTAESAKRLNIELTKGLDRPALNPEEIRVSTTMKAMLTGAKDDFQIDLQSPEEQIVDSGAPTEWRWTVTPLRAGNRRLHLSAIAVVKVEGAEKVKEFSVYDTDITVKINVFHYLTEHWKAISGAVTGTGTVVGSLLAWFKQRKKNLHKKR
jgi:TonB family protein